MADPQAAVAAAPSEWIRVYHAAHKRHYYFNTVTESSQWVRPKGVVVADAAPDVQERADRAVSASASGGHGSTDGSSTSGPIVTGPTSASGEAAAGSGAGAAGAGEGSGASSPERPTKPRKRGIRKLQSIAKGVANILGIRKRKAGKGEPDAMTANPLSPVAAAAAGDGKPASPAAAEAAAGAGAPSSGAPGGTSNGRAAPGAAAGAGSAAAASGSPAGAAAAPAPAAATGDAATPGGLKRTMSAGEMKPELRRVRSILKRSSTMHAKREEDRRISFADQNGHNLENVVYCDNLHYSQQPNPFGAPQPDPEHEEDDGSCAVM